MKDAKSAKTVVLALGAAKNDSSKQCNSGALKSGLPTFRKERVTLFNGNRDSERNTNRKRYPHFRGAIADRPPQHFVLLPIL